MCPCYIAQFADKILAVVTCRGLASAERVFSLVDRIPVVPVDKGLEPAGDVLGDVEFRDVWFHYKGRDKVRRFAHFYTNLWICESTSVFSAIGRCIHFCMDFRGVALEFAGKPFKINF